jgi:hypothetical protein
VTSTQSGQARQWLTDRVATTQDLTRFGAYRPGHFLRGTAGCDGRLSEEAVRGGYSDFQSTAARPLLGAAMCGSRTPPESDV